MLTAGGRCTLTYKPQNKSLYCTISSPADEALRQVQRVVQPAVLARRCFRCVKRAVVELPVGVQVWKRRLPPVYFLEQMRKLEDAICVPVLEQRLQDALLQRQALCEEAVVLAFARCRQNLVWAPHLDVLAHFLKLWPGA